MMAVDRRKLLLGVLGLVGLGGLKRQKGWQQRVLEESSQSWAPPTYQGVPVWRCGFYDGIPAWRMEHMDAPRYYLLGTTHLYDVGQWDTIKVQDAKLWALDDDDPFGAS
jgi:hypothetical protein